MGIIFKYKKSKNFDKYSNKKLLAGFYKSLVFFGEHKNLCNVTMYAHLLGQRNNFYIVNSDHHIEMLKRAGKFCYQLGKIDKKILYVNDSTNLQFDGIIKAFSYRSAETSVTGHWPCGVLTKNVNLKIGGLLVFDPKKSYFSIKEALKLGLPVISLNNINSNSFETMYPIVCNNLQGDSLFFNIVIINHSILEGKLFQYYKKTK
jgi:ribosomal protein S2